MMVFNMLFFEHNRINIVPIALSQEMIMSIAHARKDLFKRMCSEKKIESVEQIEISIVCLKEEIVVGLEEGSDPGVPLMSKMVYVEGTVRELAELLNMDKTI